MRIWAEEPDDDGPSLYPLQWMLIESRNNGLVLSYDPPERLRGFIQNPLELAFPEPPQVPDPGQVKGSISDEHIQPEPLELQIPPWTARVHVGLPWIT